MNPKSCVTAEGGVLEWEAIDRRLEPSQTYGCWKGFKKRAGTAWSALGELLHAEENGEKENGWISRSFSHVMMGLNRKA